MIHGRDKIPSYYRSQKNVRVKAWIPSYNSELIGLQQMFENSLLIRIGFNSHIDLVH